MPTQPRYVTYEVSKPSDAYAERLAVVGQRHAIEVAGARLCPGGVNATFQVPGNRVVKFFSASAHGWRHEATVLDHLTKQTDVPTPHLLHIGEIEDTPYVVMTEVPGVPLAQVWNEIPRVQSIVLREHIGDIARRLHQQPMLLDSWPHTVWEKLPANGQPTWSGFLQTRRARIVERQREKGCPEAWLRAMPAFLDDVAVHQHDRTPLGLLHGELNAEHLYVQQHGGTWKVSGLIDFQAATAGTPNHELSHAGFFLCWNDAELLRALLRGYGWRDQDVDDEVPRQFMAHFLLFVWCPFQRYVQRRDFRGDVAAGDFDALARRWWKVS